MDLQHHNFLGESFRCRKQIDISVPVKFTDFGIQTKGLNQNIGFSFFVHIVFVPGTTTPSIRASPRTEDDVIYIIFYTHTYHSGERGYRTTSIRFSFCNFLLIFNLLFADSLAQLASVIASTKTTSESRGEV